MFSSILSGFAECCVDALCLFLSYIVSVYRSAAPGSEVGADGQAPVVGGARNPQQMAAQKRLQQTQAQVDEV